MVFFVAIAFRWDRHLPKLSAAVRLLLRLQTWQRSRSPLGAAAALGFATPLLPCGPLYFLVAIALLSGSALRGVEFMLAFGLGTVPLLWLAQDQFHRLRVRLSPSWSARLRVVLGLTVAVLIAWRLRATLGFAGPDPSLLLCR